MKLQIIQDEKGKPTGVFIPIKEWEKMKKENKSLKKLEYVEPSKEELLAELKEAVEELRLIEEGKLKARPIDELLGEL